MLKQFTYKFTEGPFRSISELLSEWKSGNCRRAVQYFLYRKKRIFLKPEQVLCPEAFYNTGTFIMDNNNKFNSILLKEGDIIYAEKIRNKEKKVVNKNKITFSNYDEYIVSLHTALYTNKKGKEIWHASLIEGKSSYWSLNKFLYYYKPVVVKRITL